MTMTNTQVNTVNTQKNTLYIFCSLFSLFLLSPYYSCWRLTRVEIEYKRVTFWAFTTVTLLYSILVLIITVGVFLHDYWHVDHRGHGLVLRYSCFFRLHRRVSSLEDCWCFGGGQVIVQYLCSECGRRFSFIEAPHEAWERRRTAQCPWCSCRTLVLVHRETFNGRKEKQERMYHDWAEMVLSEM